MSWRAIGALLALATAVVTGAILLFARDFPTQLALLSAVGTGGLVYALFHTVERVRSDFTARPSVIRDSEDTSPSDDDGEST